MPVEDKVLTGIFGGSFDPPHEGHSGILKSFFAEIPDCKEIFLIPNRQNPLKEKKITGSEDILGMLHLFVQEFSNPIQVLDLELKKQGPSYTIETIRELGTLFPDRRFVLLIGEDNYASFHNWKDWKKILNLIEKIFVFRRSSLHIPLNAELREASGKFEFLENPLISASSTELRESFSRSFSPSGISKRILDYIQSHRLYSR